MKKTILAASALLSASAFGFVTWNGGEGLEQVKTELGNDTKTFGYWFSYDDTKDGGKSNVTWPVAKGNEYDANSLAPVIAECSGVCGTANLDPGTLTYEPFVGIGFNIVGESSATDKTPAAADASAWGGVCITYMSQVAAKLEMGQGDAGDTKLKNGPPFVDLPKSETAKTMDIAWSEFNMPDWAIEQSGVTLTGTDAAKTLVAIKFKIQAAKGAYTFNIMSIGAKGGGCAASSGTLPTPSNDGGSSGGNTAIGFVAANASAKAILSGRTLSFSGIDNAKVEILNLQGQVVLKGSASSTASMNLVGLDAGVYMVRVAGKSVNMSQKILVK